MLVDDQLFVKDEDKQKSTPLSVQECHQAKAPPLEDEEFLNGKLLNFRFVERSDELKFIKLRKQFSNYGLVNLSGRTFVIKPSNKQGRETYDFSSLKDLHEFHTPDTYRVIEETPRGDQERVVRFSETWIKHDQLCKRYTSVDFNLKPGFNNPSVFNMWSGFVEPIDGDADPFVNHIESLLVNESKTYAEAIYLIKLLAWVVQNPHMTVEVLLLLIGPQGFGKSTVTEILRSLCPNHTATTSNLDNFMKWNGATANCKIIGLEEAFSNGNYLVRQQLKNAITNTWREIENKGQNPFYIPNVVFYIGTSNSDRPFSIDHDDRRTAVFAINKAGDTAYFDMFYDWLHNQGGNQIIMGYLLRLDLTGFNRKDIPNTKARAALKVNSWVQKTVSS